MIYRSMAAICEVIMIHPLGISNKYNLAVLACISSSFSTVIHLMYQINYNCFNEPFAVLLCSYLYLDMHGLVFETSIWLLAESTRLLHWYHRYQVISFTRLRVKGTSRQSWALRSPSPLIHLSYLQSTSARQVKVSMKIFRESLQVRHLGANLPKAFTWVRPWQDLPK